MGIQNNSFFNFSGISTGAVCQFNVETVYFWKIFDFGSTTVYFEEVGS